MIDKEIISTVAERNKMDHLKLKRSKTLQAHRKCMGNKEVQVYYPFWGTLIS